MKVMQFSLTYLRMTNFPCRFTFPPVESHERFSEASARPHRHRPPSTPTSTISLGASKLAEMGLNGRDLVVVADRLRQVQPLFKLTKNIDRFA